MPIALIEWKPMRKNTLRGFATVRYGSLTIRDVTVHNSNGKTWAGMPSKPMIGSDNTAKTDERGKIKYVSMLEWSSGAAADRFSEEVVAAVETQYPDATT